MAHPGGKGRIANQARAIGDQCDQPEGKIHEQQPTGDRRHPAGTVATVGVGPKLMTGCPEYDGQCGADSRFFDVQALEKMQRGRGDRKRQSCSPRRSLSPVQPAHRQHHGDAHRGCGPGCDAGRGVTHYLGDHGESAALRW